MKLQIRWSDGWGCAFKVNLNSELFLNVPKQPFVKGKAQGFGYFNFPEIFMAGIQDVIEFNRNNGAGDL